MRSINFVEASLSPFAPVSYYVIFIMFSSSETYLLLFCQGEIPICEEGRHLRPIILAGKKVIVKEVEHAAS